MKLKDWNNKTFPFKILTILGLIISITVIILSFLQIFRIWDKAIHVFEPLLGVLMVIQAIENWKTNRFVAYVSFFCSSPSIPYGHLIYSNEMKSSLFNELKSK